MTAALVIAWRDFRAAFNAPATYFFVAAFLAVAGATFLAQLVEFSNLSESLREQASRNPLALEAISVDERVVQPTAHLLALLLLVVAPLLTMRAFAEERRSGTLELLVTSPVRPTALVLGKFLGALGLVLVPLVLTLAFPLMLVVVAEPDAGLLGAAYLGLFLCASLATAVGVACSALTESPLLAAFLTFVLLVVSAIAGAIADATSGPGAELLARLSLTRQVAGFIQGVVDLGAAAWFFLATAAVLFLTQRLLDAWRWA